MIFQKILQHKKDQINKNLTQIVERKKEIEEQYISSPSRLVVPRIIPLPTLKNLNQTPKPRAVLFLRSFPRLALL